MSESVGIGARVREIRKRRGLTQSELAVASGVSISLVTKLESGAHGGVRLETVHKLAIALQVTTSALTSERDAGEPDARSVADWEPLRSAVGGTRGGETGAAPTIGGVRGALNDAVDAVLGERCAELRVTLPVLRDADVLVGAATGGAVVRARQARSEMRQIAAAYLLGQTWQFDAARWRA